MSRLAVKAYMAQQLALLDVPVPLTVLTQRPKETEVGEKAVIVIAIESTREQRFTVPRGGGSKKLLHKVRCDLYWMASEPDVGGNAFDQLLDQVDGIVRAVTLPVTLADPQSGAASNLFLIGEDIETSVNEPLLDASLEGYVVFSASKTYDCWEAVQG